jgi:arylsulfatase A-like enzyme
MSANKPNILLILSDQQRVDTVSAYAPEGICRTPHIDALARRGVRFDNAFTPTAICSPARASLFTGRYPHKHGVTGNECCLRDGILNLCDPLREAGYQLGYAGKWHVDEKRGPTAFGFTGKDFLGYAFPGSGVLPGLIFDQPPVGGNPYAEYLQETGYSARVRSGFQGNNPGCQGQELFALHDGPLESCIEYFVTQEAIRLLKEFAANNDTPFFLWANFWGPHSPSLVPEPYFSMYDPAAIPEHPSYCETFEKKPYVQQLIERMWGLGDFGWKGFQEIAARYFGHCTLIDDMVGRIVQNLEDLGVLENTIVIYSTDHGDAMGAHRLIEKGEFMYDEIYKIPLIAAHPKCKKPGSSCGEFVYLHDLASTVAEAASGVEPAEFDGRSILPAMIGGSLPFKRDEVYCTFDRHFTHARQRMVRTRTHQLTFNSSDRGELYDLEDDPWQLNNVYGDPRYSEIQRDLFRRMERYMEELEDPLGHWFRRISPVY